MLVVLERYKDDIKDIVDFLCNIIFNIFKCNRLNCKIFFNEKYLIVGLFR